MSLKVKHGLLLSVLVAMFALTVIPVYANEPNCSGYVPAAYQDSWTYSYGPWKHVDIEGGAARRWWTWKVITNVGDFPLTEAILTFKPFKVWYYDEEGILQVTTNPTEIGELVRIINWNAIWDCGGWWNGAYILSLGTIKSGHSHRHVINWWTASNVVRWCYYFNVWYLP